MADSNLKNEENKKEKDNKEENKNHNNKKDIFIPNNNNNPVIQEVNELLVDQQQILKKVLNYNKDYIELELSIPEAFHKLAEENKALENLDIKSYSKDNEVLSQFKSIKKLNLKNGDKIFIKIRENQGW